jgi:REP element-mobilizing transposase RayT
MSRPLRIEYPGAFYHVMNRGAGRKDIFEHDDHRFLFLELLREIHETFKVEVHAYCLMDNHYHLLLETPLGNLGRAMRHLNGVYTQRYNRLMTTDGPLFRGRYKAIVVDADDYLLSVSRYIHRNPVEAGMVRKAQRYPWSSYPAYVGKRVAPEWLTVQTTLNMIGQRRQMQRYQAFVEMGLDDDAERFYARQKLAPVMGDERFIESLAAGIEPHYEIPDSAHQRVAVSIDDVVSAVMGVFDVAEAELFATPRGRGRDNPARSAALYLSRRAAGKPLAEIAERFGLAHYGSVSGLIGRFAKRLEVDKPLADMVEDVVKTINVET